jgi:hypothetical protein
MQTVDAPDLHLPQCHAPAARTTDFEDARYLIGPLTNLNMRAADQLPWPASPRCDLCFLGAQEK